MVDANGTRACIECGGRFPINGRQTVCSVKCVAERSKAKQRQKRTDMAPTLACRHCAKEFKAPANRLYCCRGCKDAARQADPIDRVRRNERARRRGMTAESRLRAAEKKRNYYRTHGRGDRSAEFAKRRAKMGRPTKDWVALALKCVADICATSARKEWAIRVRVGRADAIKVRKPAVARGQSDYTKKLKSNPVAYIAAIGRWRAKTLKRKTGKTMIDDGTASAVAVSLMATKACLYCACGLTDDSRTIDHMDSLSKGGTHSASNLCACCWSCNSKKGSKGFMQFVAGLGDKHRRRAVAHYEKLNGFVQQWSMSFGMAA